MRTSFCAVCVTLLVLASATAQPELPAELKVLDKFLGDWRTTYKLLKPEFMLEATGSGEYSTTRELGGRFNQEKSKHADGSSGMTITSYDPEKKCYRRWYFSSTGLTIEKTGKWDGTAKTMTWTTVGPGPDTGTTREILVDNDNVEWDVTIRDNGGKVLIRMEGTSQRVKKGKK